MDQEQLKRTLNSVGKSCFVKYFNEFKNPAYSNQELVYLLHRNEGYEKTACNTRVTKSRKIFREGMEKEALEIIISSQKVDVKTYEGAKDILISLQG